MKKLTLARATASLADFARALNGDVLVLTESGKPIAALVPIQEVDLESLAVGTSPKFLDLIERARRRYEQEGGISLDEMRQRLDLREKPGVAQNTARPKSGRKTSKGGAPARPK